MKYQTTGAATGVLLLLVACGDDGPGMTNPPVIPPPANELPTASFTTDVTQGGAPLAVSFDASGSVDPDGSIATYAWAFGDGGTGSGAQVTHTYSTGGEFTAVLTVTDDRGGQDGVMDTVYVDSPAGSGSQTLEGSVFFDRDLSGSRNGSESGLERFAIFLDENDNGSHDAGEIITFTDSNGDYRFEGLDAGRSYTVTQRLPFGWTNTTPGTGGGAAAQVPAARLAMAGQIFNGEEADLADFPFQVALVVNPGPNTAQFCGGTLIASRWVMTAAHCLEGLAPGDLNVLVGTDNLSSGGQRVAVTSVRTNPAFRQAAAIDSDVGLLLLAEPLLRPRAFLQSAEQAAFSEPGTPATVIGWGLTETGSQPSRLRKVEVPILDQTTCADIVGDAFGNITAATICAGGVGIEKGPCFGDSGGPLLVPFPQGWLQVGIVSFGRECGGLPGVFARVSTLLDYVRSVVPPEESGSWTVEWSGGFLERRDFANFH